MVRLRVEYTAHYEAVMRALTSHGLLLGSCDAAGRPNVMTIGWGALGSLWGEPIWTVLVRPKRYTFRCIEHTGCFTVNVPTAALGWACIRAGSVRGEARDAFEAAGLTPAKARSVLAPVVEECPVVYECQVVHSNDVLPNRLADDLSGLYVDHEPHRMYHGRILAARAADDAAEQLA